MRSKYSSLVITYGSKPDSRSGFFIFPSNFLTLHPLLLDPLFLNLQPVTFLGNPQPLTYSFLLYPVSCFLLPIPCILPSFSCSISPIFHYSPSFNFPSPSKTLSNFCTNVLFGINTQIHCLLIELLDVPPY